MTRAEFALIMAPLLALFEKVMTEMLADIYFIALSDLGRDRLIMARDRAIRECKWFPKPVELRDLAGVNLSITARAEKAFEMVSRARDTAGVNGAYLSVNFGRETNRVVRELGGWAEVWKMDDAEWTSFARERFFKIYNNFSSDNDEGPALLPGALGAEGMKVLDFTKGMKALPEGEEP